LHNWVSKLWGHQLSQSFKTQETKHHPIALSATGKTTFYTDSETVDPACFDDVLRFYIQQDSR